VVMSDDHRIYLEWCQESTGSYIYFDLFRVIQKTKQYQSLHVDSLTIKRDKNNNNDILDKSCYFDESVPIESRLKMTDTLILSPLRSVLARYSPMGLYQGHQLYLGPTPTEEFMNKFAVKYICNCRVKRNDKNLLKNTKAKERLFNVAGWKYNKQYIFTPLDITSNEQKSNDDDNKNNQNIKIKMNQMEYLDAMIDEIHSNLEKGNVIIHYLAGAHRSPFITGCYLAKYGALKSKSPQDIYKYMKQKRPIVQELGYDKELALYQQFLKERDSDIKSD